MLRDSGCHELRVVHDARLAEAGEGFEDVFDAVGLGALECPGQRRGVGGGSEGLEGGPDGLGLFREGLGPREFCGRLRGGSGCFGFVGGERPAALQPSEIVEIRSRIEAANGKEVPKVQYTVGEEVKITDGAFASLTGRIDEIDPDRGKLKVSVSIFGRFTPVELEYWQVQRNSE